MDFKRDLVREDMYVSNFKIKPEIYIKFETNPDYTFKTFTIKYKFKDKEWILKELYKDNTNLTESVSLIMGGEIDVVEFFNNPKGAFNDAEHKLVAIMKSELDPIKTIKEIIEPEKEVK